MGRVAAVHLSCGHGVNNVGASPDIPDRHSDSGGGRHRKIQREIYATIPLRVATPVTLMSHAVP